jgi:hypothetical protein
MARTPTLLRLANLLMILTCSGCASWHYRKEDKKAYTSSNSTATGGFFQDLAQAVSYDSLHNWGEHTNRW